MVMTLSPASIDKYLTSLSGKGYSPNSLRSYRSDLTKFADHYARFGGVPVTFSGADDFEFRALAWIGFRRPAVSPATLRRNFTAVRGFGVWLTGSDAIMKDYRLPTIGTRPPHPLPEGIDGVVKMYECARSNEQRALVVLCGLMGLRVSEARSICWTDFDDSTGDVTLTVRGKGDKTRFIPVVPSTMALLDPIIQVAVFNEGGLLIPMSDRGARQAITRIGHRALGHPVASHDLRMTFGTASYGRLGDIRATQELLGHASVSTTEGYTKISDETKAKAADVL